VNDRISAYGRSKYFEKNDLEVKNRGAVHFSTPIYSNNVPACDSDSESGGACSSRVTASQSHQRKIRDKDRYAVAGCAQQQRQTSRHTRNR